MDKLKTRIPPPIVMLILAALMWGISQVSINIEITSSIRMLSLLTLTLLGIFSLYSLYSRSCSFCLLYESISNYA